MFGEKRLAVFVCFKNIADAAARNYDPVKFLQSEREEPPAQEVLLGADISNPV